MIFFNPEFSSRLLRVHVATRRRSDVPHCGASEVPVPRELLKEISVKLYFMFHGASFFKIRLFSKQEKLEKRSLDSNYKAGNETPRF